MSNNLVFGFWASMIIATVYNVSGHPFQAILWLAIALLGILLGVLGAHESSSRRTDLMDEISKTIQRIKAREEMMDDLIKKDTEDSADTTSS